MNGDSEFRSKVHALQGQPVLLRAGKIKMLAIAYAAAESEMRKQKRIMREAKAELAKLCCNEFGERK